MSLQKQRLFPPFMLHLFKFQVVYPIHNTETHICGTIQTCTDVFTHSVFILMVFHIILKLRFRALKKKNVQIV